MGFSKGQLAPANQSSPKRRLAQRVADFVTLQGFPKFAERNIS